MSIGNTVLEPDYDIVFEPRDLKSDPYMEKKDEEPTVEPLIQPSIKANLINDFYVFNKEQILNATTPYYRKFLKEAGYTNLDSCSRLEIAKNMLKWNQNVKYSVTKLKITYQDEILTGNYIDYVVNINQTDGRRLVERSGGKLLTTQLMYSLFIPYIKQEAQKGDYDAQSTLNEMIKTKSEWLEDSVDKLLGLKIGSKRRPLHTEIFHEGRFNNVNGFDRDDSNELGYPILTRDRGEFGYQLRLNEDETAIFRCGGEMLNLICTKKLNYISDNLGVRIARFL